MRRDMDLVRVILLGLENGKSDYALTADLEESGFEKEQILHHAALLVQAGYIKGASISYDQQVLPLALPQSLTWEGHEFLSAAIDESRWEQAKATMAKAGGFSVTVMKELLVALLKKQVGL